MKKRIFALLLALCLLSGACLTVFADETEPTFQETVAGTEPTESTLADPTEPTDATEPEGPNAPQLPTVLDIDSCHIYSGMDMAYEEGYLPRIGDGVLKIVLPLTCSGTLWGNKLDTTISLDTGSSSPFVVENYRKSFYLETVIPENDTEPQDTYLVTYDIPLSEKRQNGTYPVSVRGSGFDISGNAVDATFTLYITITDGKVEKVAQPVVETATAEPVVYISKTLIHNQQLAAGVGKV